MDEQGLLFASLTNKKGKGAKLAEYLLSQHTESHLGQHEDESTDDLLGASLDCRDFRTATATATAVEPEEDPTGSGDVDSDNEEEANVALAVLAQQGTTVSQQSFSI